MVQTTPLLEARSVSKHYLPRVPALDRVSLHVNQGELLVLVGESGCGKTTLLRMFNRMIEPTEGTLLREGRELTTLDPFNLRRETGYVQQEGGLLPHWTVARNVGMVPELLNWDREKMRARTQELLNLVGLDPEHYANRFPLELSGGQRQRAAIARALASDPRVILLDEPFGALDAMTRVSLQREFIKLRDQLGKTMILVTHDLDEAFTLGHRIAVLQGGKLLQTGTPQELVDNPASEYVRDLLEHRKAGEP